jgi:hypothetical protein
MSWREWAAAQYNHVLSIMKDTMDKTLFVIDRWGGGEKGWCCAGRRKTGGWG